MQRNSEFTPQDRALILRSYADLKQVLISRIERQEELDLIDKAFAFASRIHEGNRRRNGEPAILHPIAVAKIVSVQLGLGHKSICAALLHDCLESGMCTPEEISEEFSPKIATIVCGLEKMREILSYDDGSYLDQSLQAKHFKKMLLTMNGDLRIILIKMADRLHNCRTIEFLPAYKREKILSETEYLFIPLARRLGLNSFKTEMENIYLQYRHSAEYNEISRLVNQKAFDKEKMIDAFLAPLCKALSEAGVAYNIKRRVKSPYSIWNKIHTKGVTFDQINDLYAVRIIFDASSLDLQQEKDECFRIFGIVTSMYEYKPERVRDWINHPKPGGYEALHLTVITQDGTPVEVQIRSSRMDEIAEKGIAAHWRYKKTHPDQVVKENEMETWLTSVKSILESGEDDPGQLLDMLSSDVQEGDVTVFAEDGRQIDMPCGSTALDFARVSGEWEAEHCIAAKINYSLSPLSQKLHNGDRVEIISTIKVYPKE